MPLDLPAITCPAPGLIRLVSETYDGKHGYIQLCRPPWTVQPWLQGVPIPDRWAELPRYRWADIPASQRPGLRVLSRLTATPSQLRRVRVSVPRAPRAPRPARAPRPPRPPRPARAARAPRRPRKPRKPRKPRATRGAYTQPKKPKGQFYCFIGIGKDGAGGHVSHTGPWTAESVANYKRDHPQEIVFPWPEGSPCPGTARNACAEQAAFFIRPLQKLLGWRRPEFPEVPAFVPTRKPGAPRRPAPLPPRFRPKPLPPTCEELLAAGQFDAARGVCLITLAEEWRLTFEAPGEYTDTGNFTFEGLIGAISSVLARPRARIIRVYHV